MEGNGYKDICGSAISCELCGVCENNCHAFKKRVSWHSATKWRSVGWDFAIISHSGYIVLCITSVGPVPFGHCEVVGMGPKTFRKVTADNFPQCSLEQKLPSSVTHSPDRTRPGTPFFTSAIPGLRSALECRNLISSNSFAHRLGTGNSALRLAPGPVGLKPELRDGCSLRFFCRFFIFYFLLCFFIFVNLREGEKNPKKQIQ